MKDPTWIIWNPVWSKLEMIRTLSDPDLNNPNLNWSDPKFQDPNSLGLTQKPEPTCPISPLLAPPSLLFPLISNMYCGRTTHATMAVSLNICVTYLLSPLFQFKPVVSTNFFLFSQQKLMIHALNLPISWPSLPNCHSY